MLNPLIGNAEAAVNYVIALADADLKETTIASLASGFDLVCDADAITIGLRAIAIETGQENDSEA